MLCAAGYNLRWLMRAIIRLGLKALLLRPEFLSWLAAMLRRDADRHGMALADRIVAIMANPPISNWTVMEVAG